ncbi:hypothetical protein BHE74_00011567 [Ensete ventricosum]|nr:hypothetical protein BHE74_00011567 [Ensete ventricosum]
MATEGGGAPTGEKREGKAEDRVPTQYESGTVVVMESRPKAQRGERDDGDGGLVHADDGSEDAGVPCPGMTQQADHFRCVCKLPDAE